MEKYRPLLKWTFFAALFLYAASAIYGNLRLTFLSSKAAEVLSDAAIYLLMASAGLIWILSITKPSASAQTIQISDKPKWSPSFLVALGLSAFLLAIVIIVGASFLELQYPASDSFVGVASAVLIFGGLIFVGQAIYLKVRN